MLRVNRVNFTKQDIHKFSLSDDGLPRGIAKEILEANTLDLLDLVSIAGEIRQKFFARKVKIHQINNIQNGLCPEDCGYCGQAKNSDAPVKKYPLKSEDDIVNEAKEAKDRGVFRYCMVSSGTGPTDKRVKQLANIIQRIKDEVGIKTCLSVGFVNENQAKVLKDAGLDRLNHNLNTSKRHTVEVVTTHTYEDRIATLRAAKKVGLETCSGLIVGMNESTDDILDVAYELRTREVPSIPINFLVPIEGNKITYQDLTPIYCLKILCLFRLINPKAELRMGAGSEGHLRGLQSLAFYPANSLFVDGYLLTRGFSHNKTIRMIYDAGFEVDGLEEKLLDDVDYAVEGFKSKLKPQTTLSDS